MKVLKEAMDLGNRHDAKPHGLMDDVVEFGHGAEGLAPEMADVETGEHERAAAATGHP